MWCVCREPRRSRLEIANSLRGTLKSVPWNMHLTKRVNLSHREGGFDQRFEEEMTQKDRKVSSVVENMHFFSSRHCSTYITSTDGEIPLVLPGVHLRAIKRVFCRFWESQHKFYHVIWGKISSIKVADQLTFSSVYAMEFTFPLDIFFSCFSPQYHRFSRSFHWNFMPQTFILTFLIVLHPKNREILHKFDENTALQFHQKIILWQHCYLSDSILTAYWSFRFFPQGVLAVKERAIFTKQEKLRLGSFKEAFFKENFLANYFTIRVELSPNE